MPCFAWNKKKNKQPVTLQDSNKKYPLHLLSKQVLTHDTRRFRFALPTPNHVIGISVGQHVSLSTIIDNEPVIRIYTPTSSVEQTGHVEIVVKIYFKDVNPDFPKGGKMSQYLDNMKIGDTIDFRGPLGKHQYTGNGKFLVKHNRSAPPSKIEAKKISMIAGGSGITPMYQLIQHICNDPKDDTEMRLLFSNRTAGDILLRDELENLAKEHSNKLKIWYAIGKAEEDWTYSVGRINEDMIRQHIFPADGSSLVLLCGPPAMVNLACTPALETLGFTAKQRIIF